MRSYQYPVYIKRNHKDELKEAIFPIYPTSKKPIRVDLADSIVQRIIADAGLDEYLKQMLLIQLEELDEHNEEIIEPKPLEHYKPTEYSLYLLSGDEPLRINSLPQNAIALVGDGAERKAHIKESEDKTTIVSLTLSAEEQFALKPPDHDTYQPLEKTFANCGAFNKVRERILSLAHIRYFSPHDEMKAISVTYRSKQQCRCCAIYLPPIMRVTYLVEVAAGTILTISSLQQIEGGLIPMDPKIGKILSIVQSILSTLLMLPLFLSGPGAQYMGEFGGKIDAFFSRLYYKKPSRHREEKAEEPLEEKPAEQEQYQGSGVKKALAKTMFGLLLLNFLWTDANYDYIQFQALMKMIVHPDSFMPSWLVISSAWLMFIVNQANDPVFMFSFSVMMNDLINNYFDPKKPVDPHLAEIGRGTQSDEEKITIRVEQPEERGEYKSPRREGAERE